MGTLLPLLQQLRLGPDERAEAAAQALISYGAQAIPALRELLADDDPQVRWWAVRTLAEIHHPQVPALLAGALQDFDLAVQQCAALALRHQPSTGALGSLIQALQSPDRLLARLAGDALVALGERATPALMAILQSDQPAGRMEATRALALLDDPAAIPALFEALDDPSPLIAYWAELGLQRRGVGMVFFKP